MIRNQSIYLLLLLAISIYACKEAEEREEVNPDQISEVDVYILNEGNFQWGNASLSGYNSSSQEVTDQLFQSNNQQRPLGDVLQSMVEINQQAFLVVNNSSKIEILNTKSLKSVAEIKNLNSPRYILPISANKAYVSDLYQDELYIIDPTQATVTGTIPTGGWTEEMVLIGNKAFISHVDSNQVLVYDVLKDSLLHRISTYASPKYLEVDQNQSLWVSCTGGVNGDTSALLQFNSNDYSSQLSIKTTSGNFGEIELNADGSELHVLRSSGLFKMNVNMPVLPSQNLIDKGNRNLYGFGVNPKNNEIYVCDAIDYMQKGMISRYSSTGQLIHQFRVGIIPGDLYFKP